MRFQDYSNIKGAVFRCECGHCNSVYIAAGEGLPVMEVDMSGAPHYEEGNVLAYMESMVTSGNVLRKPAESIARTEVRYLGTLALGRHRLKSLVQWLSEEFSTR